MACDFNENLFKPFVSMKQKIIPAFADDWLMIPERYTTISGVALFSEKLGQKVADINVYKTLKFFSKENITLQGLRVEGSFIVGNDRTLYNSEAYKKWEDKFVIKQTMNIPKADLEVGSVYETHCGTPYLYLGEVYKSTYKGFYFKADPSAFGGKKCVLDTTKITKSKLVIEVTSKGKIMSYAMRLKKVTDSMFVKKSVITSKVNCEEIFTLDKTLCYLSPIKPSKEVKPTLVVDTERATSEYNFVKVNGEILGGIDSTYKDVCGKPLLYANLSYPESSSRECISIETAERKVFKYKQVQECYRVVLK